jgi:hypothetical protein
VHECHVDAIRPIILQASSSQELEALFGDATLKERREGRTR